MMQIEAPRLKKKAPSPTKTPASKFNDAYYHRFYVNPATRVRANSGQTNLANFVFGYLSHLEIPVSRVLDLGCGLGQWQKELIRHYPRANYQGVEISPYLCEKLGWEQGSAATFKGRGTYDLVICQSVIQYLNDTEAEMAIANLARLCRGAVYLEIITDKDWHFHCDQTMTDGNVYLRKGAWYRERLEKYFRFAGGGIFLPQDSAAVLYELEGF